MERIDRIFLITKDEDGNESDPLEINWCEDDIHGNGVPYILESKYNERQKEISELRESQFEGITFGNHADILGKRDKEIERLKGIIAEYEQLTQVTKCVDKVERGG